MKRKKAANVLQYDATLYVDAEAMHLYIYMLIDVFYIIIFNFYFNHIFILQKFEKTVVEVSTYFFVENTFIDGMLGMIKA